MPRIYVAASWRTVTQPSIVERLRADGHDVYDFRNPVDGPPGFHWREIDPEWERWSPEQFRDALQHPRALEQFAFDYDALTWCEVLLMVGPCGKSSHLELGWAAGQGKHTIILLSGEDEAELMYRLADDLCITFDEVLARLRNLP